jgi:hypothetical protein
MLTCTKSPHARAQAWAQAAKSCHESCGAIEGFASSNCNRCCVGPWASDSYCGWVALMDDGLSRGRRVGLGDGWMGRRWRH